MKRLVAFLLIISIVGFFVTAGFLVYHMWDDNRAGNSSGLITQTLTDIIEINTHDGEHLTEPTPLMMRYGEAYLGLISIPTLSLELPINKELTEENLEKTPCRYIGEISGSLIISAHNYWNHFASIGKLSQGEKVFITDMYGYEHHYTVNLVEQLHETDIDSMINTNYDLTLFTCTYDNQDRITVRCTKTATVHIASADSRAGYIEDTAAPKPNAPNYRIDYKNETVRLSLGDLYSKDNGESYTEIRQSGYTHLDISDIITGGTPIFIKKGATNRHPESEVQIIVPAQRSVLDSLVLTPVNGALILDDRYEIYDRRSWRGLPKIKSDEEFDIRIKRTVGTSGDNTSGYAASLPGTIIIKYGEYEPGKRGIISAEIVKP